MRTDPMQAAIEMLAPVDETDLTSVKTILAFMVEQYRAALRNDDRMHPRRMRPNARKAIALLEKLIRTLEEFPADRVHGELPNALHALTAMQGPLKRTLDAIATTPGRQGNVVQWARRELIQESMFALLRRGLPSGSRDIRTLALLVHQAATGEPPGTAGNWKRLAETIRTEFNRLLESDESAVPFAQPWPAPPNHQIPP
jgi:hypothetical protein